MSYISAECNTVIDRSDHLTTELYENGLELLSPNIPNTQMLASFPPNNVQNKNRIHYSLT